jgi:Outer membrane protein beta-barrel domain
MLRKVFGLSLVFAVVTATPAMAQLPGIEIEPYVGAYIPFQDLLSESINVPGVGDVSLVAKQKEALAVGGRVTLWLAGPIGVEGNFVYAFSDGEAADPDSTVTESAGLWVADARLIWKVLPGPIGIHLNGGIAVVGRSGDFYQDIEKGKTDIGGAVGAGLRFKLPGMFAIRADADVYLYSAQFTITDVDLGAFTTESQFQADLVVSAGLVIGLGG